MIRFRKDGFVIMSLKNFIIITVVLTCSVVNSAPAQDIRQILDGFPLAGIARYENASFFHVNPSLLVIGYSQRTDEGEPQSQLLAYRAENNEWRQVFQQTFEPAYNLRLEQRTDLEYMGQPILIVKVQSGGAMELLYIYAEDKGTLRLIQTLDAGRFEWSYEDDKGLELVGVPASRPDQLDYYHWAKNQFQEGRTP